MWDPTPPPLQTSWEMKEVKDRSNPTKLLKACILRFLKLKMSSQFSILNSFTKYRWRAHTFPGMARGDLLNTRRWFSQATAFL